MIKVLVTGIASNIGGIETFIINHYSAMQNYGDIIFDVMCYAEHPAFENEFVNRGGRIITIPSVRNSVKSKTAVENYLQEHGQEYVALWCNKCDLFNIDFIKLAHKCNIPHVILHSHNSFNMYSGIKKVAVSILHSVNRNRVKRYATDFWTCSDYAAKWMFPDYLSDRIQFIPNAVNADSFRFSLKIRNKIRNKFNFNNQLIIGCIGRLSYVKNPIFTTRIFEEIQKRNSNSRLLFIGTGELENEVRNYVDNLECTDKISFLGLRKDVPELMQAMDCILLPSHFEGLPVVAVEAQAAGLHIFVASDGITPQTNITQFFHFLSLDDKPEKWAETILNTNLERKDTYDEIVKAGFELNSAALVLLDKFEKMSKKEK